MDRLATISDEQSTTGEPDRGHSRGATALFAAVVMLITIGLLVYSQTMSFVWDEGFHLSADAAQRLLERRLAQNVP